MMVRIAAERRGRYPRSRAIGGNPRESALQVERRGTEHKKSEEKIAVGVGGERSINLHVLLVGCRILP